MRSAHPPELLFLFDQPETPRIAIRIEQKHTDIDPLPANQIGNVTHHVVHEVPVVVGFERRGWGNVDHGSLGCSCLLLRVISSSETVAGCCAWPATAIPGCASAAGPVAPPGDSKRRSRLR